MFKCYRKRSRAEPQCVQKNASGQKSEGEWGRRKSFIAGPPKAGPLARCSQFLASCQLAIIFLVPCPSATTSHGQLKLLLFGSYEFFLFASRLVSKLPTVSYESSTYSTFFSARLFSTLICSILIVSKFARFGGPTAFLILTYRELCFGIGQDLAEQVEATVLNLSGALTGIAISTLANYIALISKKDDTDSRLIPALFLSAVAFIG